MGNCLVREEKAAMKKKRMEIKVLKYLSPLRTHQALSNFPNFPGDSIYNDLPEVRHLNPLTDMQSGHLCYLQQPKTERTKEAGVVRIKLIISKQELKEILEKEGLTIEDMMSQIQRNKRSSHASQKMWKPALECIPEIYDLY